MTYPRGIFAKAPRTGAPDFVKGAVSIKREEAIKWLQEQQGEWINLDIKEGKSGKWYAQVNDWKPEGAQTGSSPNTTVQYPEDGIVAEDIPF